MQGRSALHQLRDQAQLTRAQLATACRVNESTIWRLEQGRRGASDALIYRIANALGVDTEQVRAAIPEPPPQKRYVKAQGAA